MTALTDAAGHYTAELSAGTYRVELASGFPVFDGPHQITVSRGQKVTANFSYRLNTG